MNYDTPDQIAGQALPSWFLLPATLLFGLTAGYVMLKTRGKAARFLLFACWLRYTLGSLHEYSYQIATSSIRWVALGSLFTITLGFLILDKRRMLSKPLLPVWLICALMLVSAVINKVPGQALESVLRFLFFAVTAVAAWEALETTGPKVLKRLLFIFIQPLTYQIVSIALGVVKSGELDGSVSYIGGYYHEELFSLILATCFLVAVFAPRIRRSVRLALCAGSFVGIYLANYRTTMLGIAPLAIAALLLQAPRAFAREQRNLVRGAIVGLAAIAVVVGASTGEQRFADIAALKEGTALIKPPATFTFAEQRVLSARPYLWSSYLYAYAEAPRTQKIIGFGPDSWTERFPLYAHNTLISFLYELGILGAVAILILWISMLRIALRAQPYTRGLLVAAHASFFVLNMGTMPHWQVEGNIFYGLLCGYTIAKARLALAVQEKRRDLAYDLSSPSFEDDDLEPIWPAAPESLPSSARR